MNVEFGALARSDPTAMALVAADGRILAVNPEASRELGLEDGGDLLAHLEMPADEALAFLRACAGSVEPHIGALVMRGAPQSRRIRCDGAVVQPAASGRKAVVVLRLRPSESANSTFGALTEKLAELNAEIHRRRRVEAELKRAVAEKEVLLSELQHRVKNNLQAISSIFALAVMRESDDAVKAKLSMAVARIDAMSRTQKVLYDAQDLAAISARELLGAIGAGVQRLFEAPQVELALEVHDAILPADVAMPLGLLANELLTNAFKHAFGGGRGRIWLRLDPLPDGRLKFCVEDDGSGFAHESSKGLGMSIARGLAGQIGGELQIEAAHGAKVAVVFGVNAAEPRRK